ncbi:MAG: cobalamin-dependent protein [Candidatus Omnitrophica bacterium]|nr:cobalamin-dependent protein [Candidatus Omnitrophota bacterium]
MKKINKNINIALIFMLIGVFLFSDVSYALRVPVGIGQERMLTLLNHEQGSKNNLKAEFSYYTRDENGNLLKEPCGFPGYWTVELKIPIEEHANASVQRMVKSFSLSMYTAGRKDIKRAKFTVVDTLSEEQEGVLVRENDFYIKSSDKFGIEVIVTASFLKNGIVNQRAIFSKIAGEMPKQEDIIAPKKNAKTSRKIQKVLIVNSPLDGINNRGLATINSTSLALASLLKEAGYDVGITDISGEDSAGKMKKELEGVDIVCISVYNKKLSYIKSFTGSLKKVNQNIIIAVGGPSLTISPEHVFSHLPNADIFYRGEAEAGFVEALDDLGDLNFELPLSTRGIAIRKSNAYYFNDFISANRMTAEQLNNRPFDFSFLNQHNVFGIFSLVTSLGCPYNCIFCATGGGKVHRAMTPEKVIEIAARYQERLERLQAEGVTIRPDAWKVAFNDDDFLRDPERAVKILKLWKEAGLKLRIYTFESTLQSFLEKKPNGKIGTNIDLIDRIASFRDIFSEDFKIEIGTDAVIDPEIRRLNKGPYNEALIEEVMAELNKRNIFNLHFLVLTNADTSLEDLMRTLLKVSIFEIKYPCTFFCANAAIGANIGTFAVNKLVEDSRESLVAEGQIMRLPDFKEYDFYAEYCMINPENIPSDIFDGLGMFLEESRFSLHLRHLMLECLSVLLKDMSQKTDVSSQLLLLPLERSGVLTDGLRELGILLGNVKPSFKNMAWEVEHNLKLLNSRLQTPAEPNYRTTNSSL